ncbi:nuclear transport factor 2 family protein [Nocardia amikacinitolerans]|uniref:nuclear transport factor 2 family protein n=1 Tax=Nocardia amikacinitolerans TaxID=756689 RepID=UPI0020A3B87D|nr:nuclear transport factor 2 family protein [Nocardia amikacinitolerans]MCP2289456.1 SnoaL-like domain-containing protein [Nocardia amikacinitolerans]
MLSLQEISDRLEIQDLMVRYSHAVDTRQWDLLDEIFTADATIDYTAMGGPAGDLASTKQFLATVMPNFPAFQHLVSNSSITVDGDTATARTMCHNPMLVAGEKGTQSLMLCGLWYLDTFARVDGLWRIRQRVEEKSYMFLAQPVNGI